MCSVRLPGCWCRGSSLNSLITGISVADNDCSSDNNAVSYFLFNPTVIDVDAVCGDLSDVSLSTFVPDSQCNMACTGDPNHYCGGTNRLTLYTWQGTMNVWHTPEVTGRYEVRATD